MSLSSPPLTSSTDLLEDGVALEDPLKVDKSTLVDRRGVRFREFRATLRPRFGIVWRDIGLGYLAALGITAGLIATQRALPALLPIIVPLAALAFGYTIHYLMLFFHEAAHYNIASGRAWNDRLANWLICSWIGMEIRRYRIVHFDHHRYLGTPRDTEISYTYPFTLRTLAEAALGIRVVRYVLQRRPQAQDVASPPKVKGPSGLRQLALGLFLNATFVGGALALGAWPLALAWVAGMVCVAPLFQVIRQTLEHRDEHSDPCVDYRVTSHGEVNRLFGDGAIASSLGGAGFNRHLLHHWDPQLSYTRLKDLEEYLLDCDGPFTDHLRTRRTTYVDTFRTLFRWRSAPLAGAPDPNGTPR